MVLDLSRFKVVYGDRVLNALALDGVTFAEPTDTDGHTRVQVHATHLSVVAINEDGNMVLIADEAWRFQFVPIINR